MRIVEIREVTAPIASSIAVAKIAGRPLFRLLAERQRREADPRVFVYAVGTARHAH